MTGLSAPTGAAAKAHTSGLGLFALLLVIGLFGAACSSGSEGAAISGVEVANTEPATDSESNADDVSAGTSTVAEVEEISGGAGIAVVPAGNEEPASADPLPTAVEVAQTLGRGINFGNALDAPREGDWGVSLGADDFARVAAAGFDHVRLPVSWEGYASESAPFTIPDGDDPTVTHPDYNNIWERVDWAIDQAAANDLMIILNMHHYDAAHDNPALHADRLVGMWQQIAERYSDAGGHVVFELFNEPHGAFTEQPELWNDLAAELLGVVRETNPDRTALVGPVGFNHIDDLDTLDLPDDPNLVATVHLYEPFDFTHQGADWIDDVPPIGVGWSTNQVDLAEDFRDLTWDTSFTGDAGALRVDFSRQWAGFAVGWQDSRTPTEFRFTASSDEGTTVQVGCQAAGNAHVDVEQIQLSVEPADFVVDLSSCAQGSIGVGVLNADTIDTPVRFTEIEVCSTTGECEDPISNADAALRGWLQRAAAWSTARGVPVHLGEFGAFSADGAVPVADRAAWTATLVDEASALGIPFSYWEYNSGFGAYDQEADEWVPELLAALTG